MLTMEFSSSSDDELERELICQRRRDEVEQRHIVRAASAFAPLTPHTVVLPGGRKVAVRKGSVYIPVRDLYVHTIEAKRHPSWYFGDGSLRRHRRPAVAPETIILYAVSALHDSESPAMVCGSAESASTLVSLRDASNADFLILKEVTRSPPSKHLTSEEDVCGIISDDSNSDTSGNEDNAPHRHHQRRDSDPNVDGFLKSGDNDEMHVLPRRPAVAPLCSLNDVPALFGSATTRYQASNALTVTCAQSWATENRRVPVNAQHAFFTREDSDQVFFYNGLARTVGRFWCEPEDDVLHTEAVRQLNGVVPQRDVIGIDSFASRNVEGHTLVGRHFITSVLHSADTSLESSEPPQLHIFKGATATGSAYECWCPYGRTSLPALAVSAENDLFECTMRASDGSWERHHLRRFVNTPPTALCAVGWHATSAGQAPAALLSGMRNGTIQLTPLQRTSGSSSSGFFDATPRHSGASIVAMHALPDREFDVVTVASTGEAKLWDVRYLTGHRDPVLTLCPPRADVGTVAGFSGHFVAVATRTASLVCVDALTGTILADIQEDIPLNPERCCVARSESEYQVYLLKERRVHRVVLSPS